MGLGERTVVKAFLRKEIEDIKKEMEEIRRGK